MPNCRQSGSYQAPNAFTEESNCVFVCQNQHVLEKFRKRYLNTSQTNHYTEDSSTDHGCFKHGKLSLFEKLRRDVFPCIPLENRVVDLVLGLALFTYFWFFLDVVKLSDLLLEKALTLANLLEDTISWLGKVPAGLKLNQELVQFLGLFFKYHIHLFRGYLELLSPHMPLILYTISLTSIPGLSCFLSYTLSFSVLLLLHVHCFYAYACNLYSAQVKALVSLGRLFAGTKHNPLRNRVDSVRIQGDQLILGTLLFSVLLFLFPTTLLYYCVFTLVKLTLIMIQVCITTTISIIRTLPIKEMVQILLKDHRAITDVMIQSVTDCDVHFRVGKSEDDEQDPDGNVFLVTAVYKSLGSCLGRTRIGNHRLSIGSLRNMCLRGDIIKISF